MVKDQIFGDIYISDQVLVDLIGYATLQTYGVIRLAKEDIRTGILRLARRRSGRRSIIIERENHSVKLDVLVVIEYGINLAEVARNLSGKVRYEVEKYTGLSVSDVKVHVKEVK